MWKAMILGTALSCLGLCANAIATVRGIAAGSAHNLVLAADGTVWTWGQNVQGQLGDGTTTERTTPVQVAGLSEVIAVAAGYAHSLALKSDGTVWVWGNGRSSPVRVSGLSEVVALAAGSGHNLALRSDGTVWAWGAFGQLGDRTAAELAIPTPVTGLTEVIGIAAGQAHSLAVRRDGTVWAWGNNSYGQLGDGTIAPLGDTVAPALVQVSGIGGAIAVAAGYGHSLALKADGTVWAWGHNGAGQLGDGTSGNLRLTPVEVSGLAGVTAVAVSGFGSLALKNDGTLWRFGDVGLVPSLNPSVPAEVRELSGVRMMALPSSAAHGLVLKSDGTLWAWGQPGRDGLVKRSVAGQVGGLSGVVAVAASKDGGLALKGDGTVWQWGGLSTPFQVMGVSGVVAIAACHAHNVALTSDGTVLQWIGQSTPVRVSDLAGVAAIAVGPSRRLAAKGDGTVWQWDDESTPVQVAGLGGVVAVAVVSDWSWWEEGKDFNLALKSDGTVWAWSGDSPALRIGGLADVVALGGGGTGLAVTGSGQVWDLSDLSTPVVTGLSAKAATAGDAFFPGVPPHTLALMGDGTVLSWGYNGFGQLGDGTVDSRAAPVRVPGLGEVAAVAAGGYHSLAVKRDGTVWAWGEVSNGQAGDGRTLRAPVELMQPGSPDLTLAMRHYGDFTPGTPDVYNLTIANVGMTSTEGAITMTDMLPPGLTYISADGTGWTCSAAAAIVTCTNPGPVSPKTSSTITLMVNVEPRAWPGVTNLATVTNPSDTNSANNIAGNPTVVRRDRQ